MLIFRDKYSIEQLRNKVYSYEASFKRFQEIDEQKYEELRTKIYDFMARLSDIFDGISNLDNYIEMLGYISHKVEYNHSPYDERIVMLVEAVDPDYVHYKKYLTTERDENFNRELARNVRQELGFYDPKLISYESILFNKFKKQNEFIHGIKEDCSDLFYKYLGFINSLDGISLERREKVSEIVNNWLANMSEDDNYLTAFYHALFQGKVLGLESIKEKAIFLVETIDPNLDMLDTYYNNNKKEELEEEAKEKVGFYNDEFLRLEKMYAKVYNPELAEDPWSVKKNTR